MNENSTRTADENKDGRLAVMRTEDGADIHYRQWQPDGDVRAVVQIVHGAAEHGGRYARFAGALLAQGYAVYASDHRGHGLSRMRSGQLGDAGADAWEHFVSDEMMLSALIRRNHPGAPLILFGHSMGSFIAQDYITRGMPPDALILSGTAYGPPPPAELIDALDAAADASPLTPSDFWRERFSDFNKAFSNGPGFEWLSRDADEVRKYEDDPLAGFAFTNELVRDFFRGMAALRDPVREARIPTALPVLVIQGALDPVGANLEATRALIERYRALGLSRVDYQFYEGARHELLNETNREDVQRDVLAWLDRVMRSARD